MPIQFLFFFRVEKGTSPAKKEGPGARDAVNIINVDACLKKSVQIQKSHSEQKTRLQTLNKRCKHNHKAKKPRSNLKKT